MIVNTCKEHSDKVKRDLKKYFSEHHVSLAIYTNGTPEGERYIRNKIKVAEELGVGVVVYDLTSFSLSQVISHIKHCSEDGVMVQMPFSRDPTINKIIMDNIPPHKDVDGLNYKTKHLYRVYPATARGIFECFFKNCNDNVVIFGRSKLVGEPLADLLMHSDNTVSVLHSKSYDPDCFVTNADALVLATGKQIFGGIHEEWERDRLEDDSNVNLIVDVGIRVSPEGKLVGDCSETLKESLGGIECTPVPNGVGLLTTTYLYYNLRQLHEKQFKTEDLC